MLVDTKIIIITRKPEDVEYIAINALYGYWRSGTETKTDPDIEVEYQGDKGY